MARKPIDMKAIFPDEPQIKGGQTFDAPDPTKLPDDPDFHPENYVAHWWRKSRVAEKQHEGWILHPEQARAGTDKLRTEQVLMYLHKDTNAANVAENRRLAGTAEGRAEDSVRAAVGDAFVPIKT